MSRDTREDWEASAPAEWKADLPTINKLLSDRECDAAWKLLLKHVKARRGHALIFTAGAMGALHGPYLQLPGTPRDVLGVFRIMAIFAALALETGDVPEAPSIQAFLNFGGMLLGTFLHPCGKDFNIAECRKAIRERNVVPKFDEFMAELDGYQARATTGAICRAPKFPPPPPQ